MLKRVSGAVLVLLGIWLLLPVSFYGKGFWIYLWEMSKGLGPILIVILGILIIYIDLTGKKKR